MSRSNPFVSVARHNRHHLELDVRGLTDPRIDINSTLKYKKGWREICDAAK
jgi:hypothetical protein